MPKLQEREKVPTKLISRFNFCNIQGKDIAEMDAILVCFDTFFCKKKYFTIFQTEKGKILDFCFFLFKLRNHFLKTKVLVFGLLICPPVFPLYSV